MPRVKATRRALRLAQIERDQANLRAAFAEIRARLLDHAHRLVAINARLGVEAPPAEIFPRPVPRVPAEAR
jgi:hypothetical protein